ncbi:MAG: hypothetical protein WBN81_11230 [Gammaproteobacteria bacterium]
MLDIVRAADRPDDQAVVIDLCHKRLVHPVGQGKVRWRAGVLRDPAPGQVLALNRKPFIGRNVTSIIDGGDRSCSYVLNIVTGDRHGLQWVQQDCRNC